eukprot:SAG22_NODE_16535_length_323_cov_0.910714_1_plen_52_part_01
MYYCLRNCSYNKPVSKVSGRSPARHAERSGPRGLKDVGRGLWSRRHALRGSS